MAGNMAQILREHKNNYRLLVKLAFMNAGKQTVRSSLGISWTYIHDIIYIIVFAGFRYLIAGNGTVMGMNSTVYIMTGMIPWFFFSDVLFQGSMAIRSNKGIVQSICFPIPVLPTIEVATIFIKRIISYGMLFAVVYVCGYIKFFHLGLFLYYIACSIVLAVALNMVISAFVAVSEDFRQLYVSIVRVLIYTMPILWDFTRIKSAPFNVVLRINPIVYVIKGFRTAFVTGKLQNGWYTVYFWVCTVVLFALGSYVQNKLKRYYADFI